MRGGGNGPGMQQGGGTSSCPAARRSCSAPCRWLPAAQALHACPLPCTSLPLPCSENTQVCAVTQGGAFAEEVVTRENAVVKLSPTADLEAAAGAGAEGRTASMGRGVCCLWLLCATWLERRHCRG